MNILAIETTGKFASAAIIDENGNVEEMQTSQEMNHLQGLLPLIDRLLAGRRRSMADITAIAASAGPGSFTGIRIGVSTARALAQTLGIPCVAVPTLQTFVYNESKEPADEEAAGADGKVLCCPIFDARRHQVYAGAYTLSVSDTNCQTFSDNRVSRQTIKADTEKDSEEICELIPEGAYDLQEYLQLLRIEVCNYLKSIADKRFNLQNIDTLPINDRRLHRLESIDTLPIDNRRLHRMESIESTSIADTQSNPETTPLKLFFYGDGIDKYEEQIRDFWQEIKHISCITDKRYILKNKDELHIDDRRYDMKNTLSEKIADGKCDPQIPLPQPEIIFASETNRYQRAGSVAKLALKMYREGQLLHYNELRPNYLRKAEAERNLQGEKIEELKKAQDKTIFA